MAPSLIIDAENFTASTHPLSLLLFYEDGYIKLDQFNCSLYHS